MSSKKVISILKFKIIISVFITNFLVLFTSQFFNAIFNTYYDSFHADLLFRLISVFDTKIMALFVGMAVFTSFVMLRYLRHLFMFLSEGKEYDKARVATTSILWIILVVQSVFWVIGTTFYFFINNWQSVNGLPLHWEIPLKLSTGLVGSLYTALIINITLMKSKTLLNMVDIRAGENDIFARVKDYIIILASAFYIVTNLSYRAYYYSKAGLDVQQNSGLFTAGTFITGAFFILICGGLMVLSKKEYYYQVKFLKKKLEDISVGNIDLSKRIFLINFDEVGELAVNVNKVIGNIEELTNQIDNSTKQLYTSTQNLSVSSKEIMVTSTQQAAAVKEIVSTMEDTDLVSKQILETISGVARNYAETKGNVEAGVSFVKNSQDKMDEIKNKNHEMIAGIKSLVDKIESIWDIVNIINNIVAQTRIIAFNAALEAISAGDAGKNFQIVANEIKRLADNTIASTNEIKAKINEIQHSSGELIELSEEETLRINEGWEFFRKLEDVFGSILNSAIVSTKSSENIEVSTKQQVTAFEQILLTLKEISIGIEYFVTSTKQTNETTESLKNMADSLKQILARYKV